MGLFSALGSIAGSIVGGPVGGTIGGTIGGAIDGSSSSGGGSSGTYSSGVTNPITGFSSPGVYGGYDTSSGTYNVSSTDERQSLIQNIVNSMLSSSSKVSSYGDDITSAYGSAVTGYKDLLTSVTPGYSDLRKARLSEVNSSEQSALSDLRSNLAKRRLSGSSFAANQEDQQKLGFTEQRDQIIAESYLEELDLTNQYLTKILDTQTAQIDAELNNFLQAQELYQGASQTQLDEQNYLAGLATTLAGGATSATSQLYASDLERAAKEAAELGEAIGATDFSGIFESILNGGDSNSAYSMFSSGSSSGMSDSQWSSFLASN